MNIRNLLTASIMASALMVTGTACSLPGASDPTSPSPNVVQQETGEEKEILATVNGFYAYVTVPGNADRIASVGEQFANRTEVSDEEVKKLAEDYPEVFRHFDTSTPVNIKNAYGQLVAGVTLASTIEGIKITAPLEAVKQTGSKATVNSTMVTVTNAGETMNSTADPESTDMIDLVKKDGQWVIVADAPLT